MALVESVDIPLGTPLIPFALRDPSGKAYTSNDLIGPKGLLVAFTCNHCPYAIAVWPRLIALSLEAMSWGIHTVGINPNIHPDYPQDAPGEMIKKIAEWKIPFPYLVDDTQQTAKAYKAQCTPDLYLFDAHQKLFYHGRLDDNWKDESHVRKQDLRDAMRALVSEETPPALQHPSMGCSIKWK